MFPIQAFPIKNMKNSKYKIQIICAVILICGGVLYAEMDVPYDNSKPPELSLPDAYNSAAVALGSDTNQFHCISAKIETRFSPQGEWFFTFCSTNASAQLRWVSVEFNGKAHVQKDLPPR